MLCLPISYKLNNYLTLTEIKEVCRMRNSLIFRTKIVFYWKKNVYFCMAVTDLKNMEWN